MAGSVLAGVLGCTAGMDFRSGLRSEKKGRFALAAAAYERFLERRPDGARSPEAAYRAGRIYAEEFGRCEQAVPLFEQAARRAGAPGSAPWAELGRLALLSCPEFFPIRQGASWVYVDSLSGGKNMRLEVSVRDSSACVRAELVGAYYAGKQRFKGYRRSSEREGWYIWESDQGGRQPILRYPFHRGQRWEARRRDGPISFEIVDDSAAVHVKAGSFKGCLKVKSQVAGFPSWVYDYYCPGVGRVKTTVGVPGVENANTELASYKIK
jgi:hypothetical protein